MSNPFDVGPGGMFDGLDDPTPPAFGGDLLPGVMQRGQHLRQQRRMAYGIGGACAAVLVAGAALGVAATGDGGTGKVITPATHSASPHHSKKPKHHTHSPGTTIGGSQSGGKGHGSKHPTPCSSPTPVTSEEPTTSPSPTDSVEPTPSPTLSPVTYDEPAATTNPVPTDTTCADGTTPSDNPMSTDSPTPTYSIPPLLSWAHPSEPIVEGIL